MKQACSRQSSLNDPVASIPPHPLTTPSNILLKNAPSSLLSFRPAGWLSNQNITSRSHCRRMLYTASGRVSWRQRERRTSTTLFARWAIASLFSQRKAPNAYPRVISLRMSHNVLKNLRAISRMGVIEAQGCSPRVLCSVLDDAAPGLVFYEPLQSPAHLVKMTCPRPRLLHDG